MKLKYWNEYNNPFYYWWKVRKYYKFKYRWVIGKYYWQFGDWIRMPKVFFKCMGLGWKSKYDSYRFEWPPYILFRFFKWQIRFVVGPTELVSPDIYWESILEATDKTDKRSFKEIIDSHVWSDNKIPDKLDAFYYDLLTKKGYELYVSGNSMA